MGLFSRPGRPLPVTGMIGRGVILAVSQTRQTLGLEQTDNFEVVCDIALEVTLHGQPPYQASLRQPIPVSELNRFAPGQTGVVVRVDPGDLSRVAIDFELTITHDLTPPGISGPRVIRTRGTVVATGMTINRRQPARPQVDSAAEVLAAGQPTRVALLQCEPYPDLKSAEGLDMFMFTFLVAAQPPYGVKVGNPVPAQAMRLLSPWQELPAKVMPGQPHRVVIDWAAALAENPG